MRALKDADAVVLVRDRTPFDAELLSERVVQAALPGFYGHRLAGQAAASSGDDASYLSKLLHY